MPTLAAIGWKVLDRIHGISPHGIGIAAGYLAGSWWLLREGKKRGLTEDDLSSVLIRALVGAIVGARFFYVVAHFGEFANFVDMLKIYQGGISLIGGIFGAIIAAYPFMRKHRMGFLRTMDSAAIGLAFGILFGRVGDLIIGDHLGKPTSWLLAFTYKGGNLSGYTCLSSICTQTLSNGQHTVVAPNVAELYTSTGRLLQAGVGVHQTALYDFISTFFLFALLVWLARRPRHQGVMIAVFTAWYGAMRVITDFLRVDKRFAGLTGSQWASATVGLIALFALVKWSRQGRIEPATAGVPIDPASETSRWEDEGGAPPDGAHLEAPVDHAERLPSTLAPPEPAADTETPRPAPDTETAEPAADTETPEPAAATDMSEPPGDTPEPEPEPAADAPPAPDAGEVSNGPVTSFTPPSDPSDG